MFVCQEINDFFIFLYFFHKLYIYRNPKEWYDIRYKRNSNDKKFLLKREDRKIERDIKKNKSGCHFISVIVCSTWSSFDHLVR